MDRPAEPLVDGCLHCHGEVEDPDPSHRISAFGCASCHLGNPYSLKRDRAHLGIVSNPGDLRHADRTCGAAKCHPDIVARVKKSVMSTNRGILKTIQEHWLEAGNAIPLTARDLYSEDAPENFAVQHFRKMCGGCHLWKERGDKSREIGRRGGGCSDCHVLDHPAEHAASPLDPRKHPKMTTRIPSENCVKCHNRSARIGLSYFGKYESAGYGTPYEGAHLSSRRLSGYRFYLSLSADVHFEKAGMECVDCHTATGLMGDGKSYDRLADQVDITCAACHLPRFLEAGAEDGLAPRLTSLNRKVPELKGQPVAATDRGTPLYNLRDEDGRLVFYRKRDGRPLEIDVSGMEKPFHSLSGHRRLSCQACHSAWIPQCYGCHITYRKSQRQTDWITGEETPGRWHENRSHIRFSKPALGVDGESRIYPISPCQVFLSVLDERDEWLPESSLTVFSLSAFDPHTTSLRSRDCRECHGDPKVLGLGEGSLHRRRGEWVFRPIYDTQASGMPGPLPLDGYVDVKGFPPGNMSLYGGRPFAGKEIERILAVNPCIACHREYEDPIYRDFPEAMRRVKEETGLPCQQ